MTKKQVWDIYADEIDELTQRGGEKLLQAIKSLCARQMNVEFDSEQYHAIVEAIGHFRTASSEAENLCDIYVEHLL